MSDGDAKRDWVQRVLGVTFGAEVGDRAVAAQGTRLAAVEEGFAAAVRANPDMRSGLTASLAMAQELMAAGNAARAKLVLDRMEAMLAKPEEAQAKPPLPVSGESYYELIAGDGQLVAYRKALLAWDGAKKKARSQLDGLKGEIAKQAPGLARPAEMVDRVMTRLSEDLDDTVDAAMNAADLGARAQLHRHAAELARGYLMRVNFDPAFRLVDTNPVKKLDVRGTLSDGLSQVLAALPA